MSLHTDRSTDAILTRRRPLAVLCILAAAAPAAVPRDKILALLWPEADEERGRNVLNQTLFAIRRELGDREVIVGRGELRLNPSTITSDIERLEAALVARDLDGALQLYSGPFLDGFFVSDAPGFERWADEIRSRLTRRVASLLATLAQSAENEGNTARATELRWRLVEADPLDGRATLALVRILAATGDHVRAVRVAQRHAALVREDLGSGVDPEMARLFESILDAGRALPSPPPRAPLPSVRIVAGADPPVSSRRRSWRRAGITLLTAFSLPLGWLAWSLGKPASIDVASPAGKAITVAFLPFPVLGSPDLNFLEKALPELLSRSLDGIPGLRSLDQALVGRATANSIDSGRASLATIRSQSRLGAQRYISGQVLATPQSLRISADVSFPGENERVVSVSVDGPPASLLDLVDQLAARILTALQPDARMRASTVMQLSTSSLPALKAFVTGQVMRHDGRYVEAVDAYETAVREDSTFALAWYGLSNAADWASRPDLIVPAARRAQQLEDRLSEHDRLLVRAYLAWRENRWTEAERWYRLLLHSYPDDAEAWYQFAEMQFHDNSRHGRSFTEARDPFGRVLALKQGDRESLLHLVRIAAREGTVAEVDRLAALATPSLSPSEARELRAVRAHVAGDSAGQRAVLRELHEADAATLGVVAWRVSMFAGDFAGAERILRLGMRPAVPQGMENDARAALVWILMGRGRFREAWEETNLMARRGDAESATAALSVQVYLLLTPDAVADTALLSRSRALADTTLAALRRTGSAGHAALMEVLCVAAMLDANAGHIERALRAADTLAAHRHDGALARRASNCASIVRGAVELKAGRVDRALTVLMAERANRLAESAVEALSRFMIAEAFTRSGRETEAVAWLRVIAERGLEELPLYAPAERRLAALARRRGDLKAAAEHYRRFIRFWESCDPELHPLVEDARRQLHEVEVATTRGLRTAGGR